MFGRATNRQTTVLGHTPPAGQPTADDTPDSTSVRNWEMTLYGAVLFSAVMTGVTYLIVAVPLRGVRQPDIYEFMIGSGKIWPIVQVLITLLFFWALAVLFIRSRQIKRELAGLALGRTVLRVPNAARDVIFAAQVDSILQAIAARSPTEQELMVLRRILRGMRRFQNTNSIAEIDTVLRTSSEIDQAAAENGYAGIRFAALIIPILGFIGTVYGISQAVLGFTVILQGAADFNSLKPALRDVVSHMGLAFGVTLLALLGSGIILFAAYAVQRREDELQIACDRFCVDEVIVRIRMPDNTQGLLEGLRQLIEEAVRTVMNQADRITDAVVALGRAQSRSASDLGGAISANLAALGSMPAGVDRLVQLAQAQRDLLTRIADADERPAAALQQSATQLERIVEQLQGLSGLAQLHDALAGLAPAIESMSSQLSEQMERIMRPLLKVNIIGHRINSLSDVALSDIDYERILDKLR